MSEIKNGLFLLGNIGVGKSFLGNILLGHDAFKHECSASRVTHRAEFQDATIGQTSYSIFNLPGLLEDDQAAVNHNKQEIYKAFLQCPHSLIGFIFTGGSGGRIRDEDLTAFEALNAVYGFQQQSLVLIINDLPRERSASYETETTVKLRDHIRIQNVKICLLDHINIANANEREQLRTKLIAAIVPCRPSKHQQNGQIKLPSDKIKELQDALAQKKKEEQACIVVKADVLKKLNDDLAQQQKDHQQRMAALQHYCEVTYEYYRRGQPGIIVKTENARIPIIDGVLTISGPPNLPPDLECKTIINSIKW